MPNECSELFESLEEPKPDVLVWSALLAVLFVRLVMPYAPIIRHFPERLRNLAHDLALFPFARQTLVSALSTSAFTARADSDRELDGELARYGVAAKGLSFLSRSAKQSLLEVHSLRQQLMELAHRSRIFGAAASGQSISRDRRAPLVVDLDTEPIKLASSWMLQQFGRARASTYAELETRFRRLIRRTASALLLVEEISGKVEDEALCRSISNFAAEECDDVLLGYRRLIAEAALSCVPQPLERSRFLKYFGYDVPVLPELPALPLRPWVIVFSLDFLLFLFAFVGFTLTGGEIRIVPLVLFALVHAISLTAAIAWAIYPKIALNVTSNFAWPSFYFDRSLLRSLPWKSYVVFGLASYVTGAVILLLFRLLFPMPFPIILPTLLSSLSFLLMTVGMSILIDKRLQSGSLDFEQRRVRDGLFLAALTATGTLTLQAVIFYLAPALGWLDIGRAPPFVPTRLLFLMLSSLLGFILGYFIPAAAAALLQTANLLRMAGRVDRKLATLGQSETQWDARLSPQAREVDYASVHRSQ
jgi:hypothetical protein